MTSEQLFYDKKPGFDRLTGSDKRGMQEYAEGYKTFLDEAKTERDAVKEIARMAEEKGFRAWKRDDILKAGDKIYRINRNKGIMLAVIGKKDISEGVRLTAAHLDAPRVDIRTVPLYEDGGMAFFKTHYYGGIKKYQWTAIPLELRGVVCVCHKGQMKTVEVRVGDKPDDPKFVITDLLPHLATEQMTKKATEIIKGEGLNILVGSAPSETVDEKCSEKIKLAVMEHLNRQYGMVEADFLSAELCCVPAFITVTFICVGPRKRLTFSNLYPRIQHRSSRASYMAFTPSPRAACPDLPRAVTSSTISPFSATAGCIRVGSPTIATSIRGSIGSTMDMPEAPDTSSSADARYTML